MAVVVLCLGETEEINHGIETKIEGTFLFALEVAFNCNTNTTESKWVNVTNWSNGKLYNWLGY